MMFRNYVKTTLRNIAKNKLYAFVSISGLAIGIACFLLVALFVHDELTFDRWHQKANDIYKVEVKSFAHGFTASPPLPYAEAIKEDPGVLNSVNIGFEEKVVLRKNDQLIEEKGFYLTEPSVFDVFDFELKWGDKSTALSDPKSIVLSAEIAQKYFKDTNPIGEMFELIGKGAYKISGVLEPIPANSHLKFDFLAPYDFDSPEYAPLKTSWRFGIGVTYLLLAPGHTLDKLQETTQALQASHSKKKKLDEYSFHKFTDLYLNNKTVRSSNNYTLGGDIKYVYIFGTIGVLILIIASFNYINMSTAWGMLRVKEVGVRKTVGAHKGQLIWQFLCESLIISLFSIVLGLIVTEAALPTINVLTGKQLAFSNIGLPGLVLIFFGLLSIIGFLAGFYPAIVLASHKALSLLRGSRSKSSTLLRKVLITVQFCICATLFISTLVVKRQLQYLKEKDLGFNGEQVLNINISDWDGNKMDYGSIKNEILRLNYVKEVTGSPLPGVGGISSMNEAEGAPEGLNAMAFYFQVDHNFLEFFDMDLVAGRNFNPDLQTEGKSSVLVNESFVKKLGWQEALGKKVSNREVVGVVKDFHFFSTKEEIKPLLIALEASDVSAIHIRYAARDTKQILSDMEDIWKNFTDTRPFEYSFMDQAFEAFYEKEEKVARLFNYFSVMVLVISCTGLFGLTAFVSEQRRKEIGIRKVLGADMLRIMKLLTSSLIVQVAIASAVAIPLAYYATQQWLDTFPYRVSMGIIEGVLGITVLLITGLITTGYHGIKSASTNPAEAMRDE